MKVMIVCSKAFYSRIKEFEDRLKELGHEVILPNCYDAPETEAKYRGTENHASWKAEMFRRSIDKIKECDAVLTLNYDKDGVKNYIGGATFLELYEAFKGNKKIYFVNPLPELFIKDELIAFNPIIIGDNLELIK